MVDLRYGRSERRFTVCRIKKDFRNESLRSVDKVNVKGDFCILNEILCRVYFHINYVTMGVKI